MSVILAAVLAVVFAAGAWHISRLHRQLLAVYQLVADMCRARDLNDAVALAERFAKEHGIGGAK